MSMPVVLVTGGYDHKIRFWEATGGQCVKIIPHTTSQVNCISISADKCLIAVGGNPQIQLFDVNSAADTPVLVFDGHSGNVTVIGFQKDLKWLYSSSEDNTVKVWDLRTPSCLRTFDCYYPVNTVCLHPNQRDLISGDENGCMRIWDLSVPTGPGEKCSSKDEFTPLPDVPIRSISIACDATILAVGSHKGHLLIYVPDQRGSWVLNRDILAHEDYLLKCVISPDASCIATTSADKTIKLWTVLPPVGSPHSSGPSTNTNTGTNNSSAGSSGSSSISGVPGNSAGNKYELDKVLAHHQRWVWDAVFSADSLYMVTVSSDQTGKLWNIKTGEVMKTYVGHNLTVSCVALNDSS